MSETKTRNCKICKKDFIQLKGEHSPKCPGCTDIRITKCKNCNSEFQQLMKGQHRSLCENCSEQNVVKTVIKTCKGCGEDFEKSKTGTKQYCDNCGIGKRPKTTETKITKCQICNNDFEQLKTARTKKCRTCTGKATYQRNKERDEKAKKQINDSNTELKTTICKGCQQEFSQLVTMKKVKCTECVREKQRASQRTRDKINRNQDPIEISEKDSKKTICSDCNEEFIQAKTGKKVVCDPCKKNKKLKGQAKWREENRESKNKNERLRRAKKVPEKKEMDQKIKDMKNEGSEISDEYWKVCKTCNVKKTLDEYYLGNNNCSKCQNKATNVLYSDRRSTYYEEHKEIIAVQQHESYERNKIKIREKEGIKYCNDEDFRKKKSNRGNINNIINNNKNDYSKYLACDADFFRKWIQYCFDENMNFDNYGTEWHVDHVIPLKKFDVTKNDDFVLCFNWRNTGPMNSKENMNKKAKLRNEQIIRHKKKLLKFSDTEETREYLKKWESFIENNKK